MADFYVATTGSGTGVGTEGDPFTLAQAVAKADYSNYDNIWIKAGTYTLTSTLTVADTNIFFRGYNTTINDLDEVWGEGTGATAKPVITKTGAVNDLVSWNDNVVCNLVFTGADRDNTINGTWYNCVSKNAGDDGYITGRATLCIADSNTDVGFGCDTSFSLAKDNGGAGYGLGSHSFSVAYSNTGQGFLNFATGWCAGCTSYDNGGDGFEGFELYTDCISAENGGWGYDSYGMTINCNAYNNTSGTSDADLININLDTSDPALTSPATDDFSPGANMYKKGAYIKAEKKKSSRGLLLSLISLTGEVLLKMPVAMGDTGSGDSKVNTTANLKNLF